IEFGIGIRSEGYNVYVLGPVGTGRATAIERFLQARTGDRPAPPDWVYVHNFRVPHQPRAIALPAGQGSRFQTHMSQLIANLRRDLPQAFETETYEQAIEAVQSEFGQAQERLMQEMQHRAAAAGFGLLNTPSGLTLVPVQEGQPLPAEALQALPIEARVELEKQRQTLADALHDTLRQVHQLETAARQQIRQIDRDVAASATQHHFEQLQAQYAAEDEVLLYLGEVRQDVLDQIDDFAPPAERDGQPIDLRRYQVNLLVDHADSHSVPVVVEQHPTFHNLFGRIEYEMEAGVVTTRFTNIKSGSLHRANGGYLIMDAEDLLLDGITWDDLKRTLKSGVIRVQPSATMDGGRVLAKSLDPEPIPLDLKLILLGNAGIYYMLYEQDEDFSSLFKVRADFDSVMPRDAGHEQAYAAFVATRCHKEKLCHFDRAAVARVVEFGSRLAEHQRKLSTRFGAVADLVREASYWAGLNGRTATTVADVRQALVERMQRANRIEERMLEQILEGAIFIATEGAVVGQVNGLSVLDTGEYSFGQAGRITARTFMGESGVMHIERETDMSGPIHQKGVLTLTGYLGGMYAQQQPLSLSASLTFEQNYGGIEGDSASSAELYALLSSLGRIPLKQGIAVTGSVNQHGEVQPIGGVNEKIEGFFRLCQARGLTGEQGVVIPASNCEHLALDEDVLAATAAGQFHVWAISRIDEGIELLTGRPAGVRGADGRFTPNSVHDIVQQRLLMLARDLKSF
ncbi:MAG: AAA family ATPase, partial [Anaerolineales bacterium]|nr:AAA family ATPase [Anaerolineales bacterium]